MSRIKHWHCDMCGKDLGAEGTHHFNVTLPAQMSEYPIQLDQNCLGLLTKLLTGLGFVRGAISKSQTGDEPPYVVFTGG